jgi:hypothetical protein
MKKTSIIIPLLLLGSFLVTGCTASSSSSSSSSSSGGGSSSSTGVSSSDSSSSQSPSSVSSSSSLVQATDVFSSANVYYDTSATAYNISVDIGTASAVSSVVCGRVAATSNQYVNQDGVLTLSGDFMSQIKAGEKTIVITTASSSAELNLFAASKVIATAQDFQDINDNLTGYFILGNDIDLSSITNFEPLGYYWSEQDANNAYFHGILEGNGHTVKNATVYYSDTLASNYGPYSGTGTYKFSSTAHSSGDNIGLFQIIGSSGVVRNVNFSNIKVRGRTIVGVIAGNCAGSVENCYIDSSCSVEMSTHFYDDDCNMGGAFGIVGSSGTITNVISEATTQTLGSPTISYINSIEVDKGVYLDYNTTYSGQTGNGWDHVNTTDPWWRFAGVDKPSTTDSNGSATDGQYAFVGKCWGTVADCVAKSFQITPMNGSARSINFGQTHLAANKSSSGDSDLGALTNDLLLTDSEMKTAANYSSFDTSIWAIADGSVPTLISQYSFID